jgi:antirestriction protein ArdC
MQDAYQLITDRLITILETGAAPWRKPWNYGSERGPLNLVSRKHYQGINCFLLACTAFSSPYWLTYKQAQDLGGNVRRGEKGSTVIFWKIYEKDDPQTEDGKKRLPLLRYYTVFNVEQYDGLTAPPPEDSTWKAHDPIVAAETVILAMPNPPVIEKGGARACYSPSRDLVRVPDLFRFDHPEDYYGTMFHELAHSIGHKTRLDREGISGQHFFGDAEYSREELVAEVAAAFLCGHCGVENVTLDNSASYLQSWIKTLRGDKKLAVVAAAQTQKAADYILNRKAHEEGGE